MCVYEHKFEHAFHLLVQIAFSLITQAKEFWFRLITIFHWKLMLCNERNLHNSWQQREKVFQPVVIAVSVSRFLFFTIFSCISIPAVRQIATRKTDRQQGKNPLNKQQKWLNSMRVAIQFQWRPSLGNRSTVLTHFLLILLLLLIYALNIFSITFCLCFDSSFLRSLCVCVCVLT